MTNTLTADPPNPATVVPDTDYIPRMSAENLATLRRSGLFVSRWLARLITPGEVVIPEDQMAFGRREPFPPAIMPPGELRVAATRQPPDAPVAESTERMFTRRSQ